MSTDSLLIKTIFVANEHALGGNSSHFEGWHYFVYSSCSLHSRREWLLARTSVPNASVKSCADREKNGEESS